MPFFEHDGLKFHFVDYGEGIPFIFQHGLGGSLEQPLDLFYPPSSVRLISFDFRGHGKTPLGSEKDLRFDVFAEDILAMMDHLDLKCAVIGGISMGAAVAINAAVRFSSRIKGLIISRPAWLDAPMPEESRRIFRMLYVLIHEHGTEHGKELFKQSKVFARLVEDSPTTANSLLNHFEYKYARDTVAKFLFLPEDTPAVRLSQWALRIKIPTLILATRFDPIHPFEFGPWYAKQIPHAIFHELTPKKIDEERHKKDVQHLIEMFLNIR